MKPRSLLVLAALLGFAFLFVHVLGAREDVSVQSGTVPPGGSASVLLGVIYALGWFSAVIVAPILAIAALLGWALEGHLRRGPAAAATASSPAPAADPAPPRPR